MTLIEIFKVKFQNSLSATWKADNMCDYTTQWLTTQKRFEIDLVFKQLQSNQVGIQDVIADVVSHDLDNLFRCQILKLGIFRKFL